MRCLIQPCFLRCPKDTSFFMKHHLYKHREPPIKLSTNLAPGPASLHYNTKWFVIGIISNGIFQMSVYSFSKTKVHTSYNSGAQRHFHSNFFNYLQLEFNFYKVRLTYLILCTSFTSKIVPAKRHFRLNFVIS